jgi:hypothetical protein
VSLGREPGHVTDFHQQPGGAGGAYPAQGGQGGGGCFEQFVQFFAGRVLALVEALQVADQLDGDPPAGLARRIPRPDPGQQRLGLGRGPVFLRPPGISSGSSWCSWEVIRVWSSPRDRRRSARIRSAASCSSLTTGRSPLMRITARATGCASVASVLQPWPAANTRVRADSLGGTSATCPPPASSRRAMCPPMPWHPSIAHRRCGHRLAAASLARYPAASVPDRPPPLSSQEIRAAAEAHRELGPEYGDAVVDSFLEKIEARLDARVDARVAEVMPTRRRVVTRLSREQRRSVLTGMAIGGGVVGVVLSFLGYISTYAWHHTARDFWEAVLIASICSCLTGLIRVFRDRR